MGWSMVGRTTREFIAADPNIRKEVGSKTCGDHETVV